MTKFLPFPVVILAALWLIPDSHTLENKHRSNLEGSDFFFDDKQSLNRSTQHSHSLKSQKTGSDKSYNHKSADKSHNGGLSEDITAWNLRRLLQYFISLLHSINENNNDKGELLEENKYESALYSKDNKFGTNQTSIAPRKHKAANTENVSGSEFENSGGGSDNEYDDEEIIFKVPSKKSKTNNFKANISAEPEFRNHEGISDDHQRNHGSNHKLTSEVFQSHAANTKHSALKAGQVSEEFIDAYINPPTENVPLKTDKKSISNQSIISNERGKKMYSTLKESLDKANISKKEDGMLNNTQNPSSSKIITKVNLTLNKGQSKDAFPRNGSEHSTSITLTSRSNPAEISKNENVRGISAVKDKPKNSFSSNNSTIFISETPQNNENYTFTTLHPNMSNQTSLKTESMVQNYPNRNTNKKTINDDKPTNVWNASLQLTNSNNKNSRHFENNNHEQGQQTKLDILSENKPFIALPDQNKDTLIINSSTIKSNFTTTSSNASANLPKQGKVTNLNLTSVNSPRLAKDMYDRTSENSSVLDDSQKNQFLKEIKSQNPEPQLQSKEKSHNREKMFLPYPLNGTKILELQGEFKSPDGLFPQNDFTDTGSSDDIDRPTEKPETLIKYPKPEDNPNLEKFKTQAASHTDSDSSDYNDSDELHEDDEYYEDTEEMRDYVEEIISNVTTQLSQNSSSPDSNYSLERELPSSPKYENETNKFSKTQKMFDTILEFLYKYSNNSWIQKMREENRGM